MFKKLAILLIFIVSIAGCKKYENDPSSSRLLSVKLRMCSHSWEHAYVYNYKSGYVYSDGKTAEHSYFSKNGDCSSESYFLSECYAWEFIDHKNQISITYRNGDNVNFKITTLTLKNFDLENDSIRIFLKR